LKVKVRKLILLPKTPLEKELFNSQWYVRGIIEFDDEDREYHISFMDGSRKSFRSSVKDRRRKYSVFTRQSP
jgi:hypothetical protein